MPAAPTLHLHIGTEAVIATIRDGGGDAATPSRVPIVVSQPAPAHREAHTDEVDRAVRAAVAGVVDAARCGAIVVSGEHGLVLLDGEGEVIRPVILAGDARLEAGAGGAIAWLRGHQAIAFKRIQLVLTPAGYVRWRLSGVPAEAPGALGWLAGLIADADVSADVMPSPVRDETDLRVTSAAAAAYGLRAGARAR